VRPTSWGETESSDFPTTPGAFDRARSGTNAFVTKLNAAGSGLVYSTFLGGSSIDYGLAIAVDESGAAYVTGGTGSDDFPTTAGAFGTTLSGMRDTFVTKLNGVGNGLVYSTLLGGSDTDNGYGIAVDGSGAAYVTGGTYSSNFPTTVAALDRTHNGASDVFVTKVNPAGSALVYSTFLGGSSGDFDNRIALDGSGAAYVTGRTGSANFPTTVGAFDTIYNGGSSDTFVTKLNAAGIGLVYSTFLGGNDTECFNGCDIVVDESGAAYVTGETSSANYPTIAGAFDTTYGGRGDVFVTKLNAAGNVLIYSTFVGGPQWDSGRSIALDRSGGAYITGLTESSNFPTTPDAFDTTRNGGICGSYPYTFPCRDIFVTKLNAAGSGLVYSTYLGGSDDDYGYGIVTDRGGAAYITGRTYSSDFPTTMGAFDTTHAGGSGRDKWDVFVAKLAVGAVPTPGWQVYLPLIVRNR